MSDNADEPGHDVKVAVVDRVDISQDDLDGCDAMMTDLIGFALSSISCPYGGAPDPYSEEYTYVNTSARLPVYFIVSSEKFSLRYF